MEVRPKVFIVERKVFFFWISLKKWMVAQTFGAYIDEEFRTITEAEQAIIKFCKKKEKPEYPKVVQQYLMECK